MRFPRLSITLLSILLLFTIAARAQEPSGCSASNPDCIAVGRWQFSMAVGLGGRSNPVVDQDNIPIVLMPQVSYYGKRFFWETDTLGFTLHESSSHMLNVILTPSDEQIYFHDRSIGNFVIGGSFGGGGTGVGLDGPGGEGVPNGGGEDPIPAATATPTPETNDPDLSPAPDGSDGGADPDGGTPDPNDPSPTPGGDAVSQLDVDDLRERKTAGLAGLEYSFDTSHWRLGVQALTDIMGVHEGSQLRFSASRGWGNEDWSSRVTLGVVWQDKKTLDYYYGLSEEDGVSDALFYQPDADLSYHLRYDWRKRISRRWDLRVIAHHLQFGDEITTSPLFESKSSTAVFFGGVYHF